MNVWLRRHFWNDSKIAYRDPKAEKLIFTLRIYSEDYDFWLLWKNEIKNLVKLFFGNLPKGQDLPNVDYVLLEQWSKENNVLWTSKDLVNVTHIIGKIRGQLRPLRFYEYNIEEFTIGLSRFVVPIQWRGEVLESWRRIVNPSISWKDCLVDIWRIGALSLVAEGRNVSMYRTIRLKEHLTDIDFHSFLESVEEYTSIWMSKNNIIGTSIYIENQENIEESFDFRTEQSLYNIGSLRFDTLEMLRLAIGSTFFEESIHSIGCYIPLDGKLFTLALPKNMKIIAEHILKIALSKS